MGLELAAGWVDALSLSAVAEEIQRGIDFLETEWRDVPARHRSIRGVFDASWRRLNDGEQGVFTQLCVFRGGFTRAAAKAIAGADLRTLSRLVDKSLLQYNRTRDRYEMHELLRQYGAEKSEANPDGEAANCERHSAYYCAALARWEDKLLGSRELEASDEIESDIQNIRAAWKWAANHAPATRLDQALEGLCWFLFLHGRLQEGDALCKLACDGLTQDSLALAPEGQCVLVKAILWRAHFNAFMHNWEMTRRLVHQSRALLGSPTLADWDTRSARALLHILLGWAAYPDWEKARLHYEERLTLVGELGHRWAIAFTLLLLGDAEGNSGNYEIATQHHQESHTLFRDVGHRSGLVWTQIRLGHVARRAGEYDESQRRFNESLAMAQARGDRRGSALSLQYLAYLALFLGRFQAAAEYLREVVVLCLEIGDSRRVANSLTQLGVAHWFSGQFDQANTYLDEATAIGEVRDAQIELLLRKAYRAWLDLLTGRYDAARTDAQDALHSTSVTTPFGQPAAVAQAIPGWVAVAEGAYAEAAPPLRKAMRVLQQTDLAESREYTAWALAALGRAEYGLGNHARAKQILLEALEIVVEIRAFIPLLHLMPLIPVVLVNEPDPSLKERAIELYALATSHPFVAKAQLFEDIAGRYVTVAAGGALPSEALDAAQARGRALGWWETAGELVGELQKLGWGDG